MFQNFFDPSAWFTLAPAQVGGVSGNIVFAAFFLLFVLGIVCRIVASHKVNDRYCRDMGLRIGSLLITMGLLGILFYFFSYERIRLFGSRFWYLLWLIGVLVWTVSLARYAHTVVPSMKHREAERAQRRKYFPPRRKK